MFYSILGVLAEGNPPGRETYLWSHRIWKDLRQKLTQLKEKWTVTQTVGNCSTSITVTIRTNVLKLVCIQKTL